MEKNKSSIWSLNELEQKSLDEFVESLSKKYKGRVVKLYFLPVNGIGYAKGVKVGKRYKDITDYLSW
jgi:hypothetical protein